MYYLQSRYYNPEWGRFINTDAIAGKVGELLGANVFAYCNNNPVNFHDSTGFCMEEEMPSIEAVPEGGLGIGAGLIKIAQEIEEEGRVIREEGSEIIKKASEAIEKVIKPDLGRKIEYPLGNATGSLHNITRSIDMERHLNQIGIFDNAEGRALITEELEKAFYDTNGVLQPNGRIMKESLVLGPNGLVKMQSIWEGEKLITVEIFKTEWNSFIK